MQTVSLPRRLSRARSCSHDISLYGQERMAGQLPKQPMRL